MTAATALRAASTWSESTVTRSVTGMLMVVIQGSFRVHEEVSGQRPLPKKGPYGSVRAGSQVGGGSGWIT
jgi:hypothetical protein